MGQIAVRLGTNQNTSPKPKGRKIVGVPMPFCLCVCARMHMCVLLMDVAQRVGPRPRDLTSISLTFFLLLIGLDSRKVSASACQCELF